MAVQTGNGSSLALVTVGGPGVGENFNTALLVLGLDMGEQTVETLPYTPLSGNLELHHIGDFATARQITANGLWDIADIPTNGPDIESRNIYNMTVTFPTAGVTWKDDGYIVTWTGPNLVNNELMTVDVVFQSDNQGSGRGWTAATP